MANLDWHSSKFRNGMTVAKRRLLLGALLLLGIVAYEMNGGAALAASSGTTHGAKASAHSVTGPRRESVAARPSNKGKRYFVEFRSRYALSYGHSYVVFGRLNQSGKMINPEVAGLHPASDSVVPYILGHIIPVPAETGWSDGDLEDQYRSAYWRVMLTEAEYKKAVANIRRIQAKSPVWHAAIYNCNAFAASVARSMGYRTPSIWLRPQQFMTRLREMNGGPNAIGTTGAPG